MDRELKIKYLVVPISLLIITIVTIILVFTTGDGWRYYLIGGALGLLTHGLMVKEAARLTREAKNKDSNPRKTAIFWFLARMIVVIGVFVGVAFLAKKGAEDDKTKLVISMVITLAGYLTCKIVFITSILILKGFEIKGKKKDGDSE